MGTIATRPRWPTRRRCAADPAWADAEPGSLAADWIMAVLVNAEREELEIQATHRLIREADDDALRSLVRDPGPIWQAIPVAPDELAGRLDAAGERRAAGLRAGAARRRGVPAGWRRRGDADRMRREPMGAAVRGLDLAILQATILEDRLGIDAAAIATGDALAYTRSEADAIRAVASGEAKAAILVRPTRLEQLAAVASAGDVMPQKSTYFYPKLLTGLVFYPLEDE